MNKFYIKLSSLFLFAAVPFRTERERERKKNLLRKLEFVQGDVIGVGATTRILTGRPCNSTTDGGKTQKQQPQITIMTITASFLE